MGQTFLVNGRYVGVKEMQKIRKQREKDAKAAAKKAEAEAKKDAKKPATKKK